MTQADIVDFASWTDPGTSFQVQYSLPLFHEIDMTVSEGYRRIPHGGIEVGGLLFGRALPDGARIEAFRPIECEHAQGPSFKLSPRDLDLLKEQIVSAPENPELGGMELLGWFIAHTRGPLQMTEAESRLFADLFPDPGKMTVLVKPEKFKPTLFTFLVRGADGSIRSNGAEQAIILPLPGRAGKADALPPREPIFVPVPAPESPRTEFAAPPAHEPPTQHIEQPEPEPLPRPLRPVAPEPERPAWRPPAPAFQTPPVPPLPAAPPPPRTLDFDVAPPDSVPLFGEYGQTPGRPVRHDTSGAGLGAGKAVLAILAVLVLAAAGALWFYQQMPPPVIQLTVEPEANGVVVSWPPDETSDSAHAFVRVNDGPMTELPADAKATGHYLVQGPADNLKVEILAQHTVRNSRGIVRYIQPAARE